MIPGMNPRAMKILIGSEPLKTKKGKTKNVVFSQTLLPAATKINPPRMHRIPIQRKFLDTFTCDSSYRDTTSYRGLSSAL